MEIFKREGFQNRISLKEIRLLLKLHIVENFLTHTDTARVARDSQCRNWKSIEWKGHQGEKWS
jgi:hypothetical protein